MQNHGGNIEQHSLLNYQPHCNRLYISASQTDTCLGDKKKQLIIIKTLQNERK